MTIHGEGNVAYDQEQANSTRTLCGILALVPITGTLGIHKFILGYTTAGVIMLILALISFGTVSYIIALIEGVTYLTKTDRDFYELYIAGQKQWF